MKNQRYVSLLALLPIFLLLFAGSCDRIGPELPRPNPPAPPAQPLVLQGTVIDADSQIGISGATVNIVKLNGTLITTTTTNSSGIYSVDVTAVTDTLITVSATKSGYGYSSANAYLSKAFNAAYVSVIKLAKPVTSPPVTVTTTTGGSTSTPNTEATTANAPVNVSIPAGAVAAPTTITVAAVPINNAVPPSASAATQNQVGVTSLQPEGVSFSKAVTMTFPLPVYTTPGTQLPVQKFNTTTNAWEATTLKAIVGSTGLIATLDVTATGQYALLDDIALTEQQTSGSIATDDGITITKKLLKETFNSLSEEHYTSTGSNQTVNKTGTILFQEITTLRVGQIPSGAWRRNLYSQRIRILSTDTYNIPFTFNYPGLPAQYLLNGVQYNPNRPNEAGEWEYRWYIIDVTRVWRYTVRKTNMFTVVDELRWTFWDYVRAKTGWYWKPHNQGSLVYGPY